MVTSRPHEAVLFLTLHPNVSTSQLYETSVTTGTSEGGQRSGPGAKTLCPFLFHCVHG